MCVRESESEIETGQSGVSVTRWRARCIIPGLELFPYSCTINRL